MPDDLNRLLRLLLDDIAQQNTALAAGQVSVDAWQQTMAKSLLTFHLAGYMAGRDVATVSDAARRMVTGIVGEQVDYLNRFADEIEANGWKEAYGARAAMYGGSIKQSYYRGKAWGYDLPAYPTEGSECMSNCRCAWRMDELDSENLDADFYWQMGDAEHCATCQQRAQAWAPLRFRGGERV